MPSYVYTSHLQVTSDNMTILEKAVIEHNMQAIGDIYRNIRLDDLARMLGLETHHAERVGTILNLVLNSP